MVLGTIPLYGFTPAPAFMLAAFGVLAVAQPAVVRRSPFLVQPFLALHTALVAALILTPPYQDFFAILILSVILVATRHLPRDRDVIWLAACCVVPSVTLLIAFGLAEGLQYVPAYVAGVLCLGLYGRASRKAEEARERSDELLNRLRVYADQVEELATTQERTRLARELHDAVTQTIFGISLAAAAAKMALNDDPAQVPSILNKIEESSEDALKELRSIVAELRPFRVADDPLSLSLPRHFDLRARREGLLVHYDQTGGETSDAVTREALFRTIQEALNNVVKHAGVNEASVELSYTDSEIVAAIRDAGRGFTPGLANPETGFGLTTMRERIETLGGSFRLTSEQNEGTQVVVRLPLPKGDITDGQVDSGPDR